MIELLTYCLLGITTTSYHIGNSIMNDGLGNGGVTKAIETVARGDADFDGDQDQPWAYDYDAGYHLRGAAGVNYIWNNPTDSDPFSEHGTWDNALVNYHWNHVLVEPYLGDHYTTAYEGIENFIDYTRDYEPNLDTKFYVYQFWPRLSYAEDFWLEDWTGTAVVAKQEYYDTLLEELHSDYTENGIVVREIPTGEVWYRVSEMIRNNEILGLTSVEDLYRDDIHASQIGRYLAVVTNFATLFKRNPEGLIPPSNPSSPTIHFDPTIVTQQIANQLNSIIWDVVSNNYYSGISDINDDGWVDNSDLGLICAEYGTKYSGRDLLLWQRNFRENNLMAIAIPEPDTRMMIAIGVLGLSTLYLHRRVNG